jgi:hypothetical protein
VVTAASNRLCGLAIRSPVASRPTDLQVDGMNCIGPTARSQTRSPSHVPPSLSRMVANPGRPSSSGPRISGDTSPAAVNRAAEPEKRPWLDSTRPMPAITLHGRWEPGRKPLAQLAASW